MWSTFLACSLLFLLNTVVSADSEPPSPSLRVCADPNNLPFSNQREEGFENALAQLIAHARGQTVAYTWWPQRRGFIRNTLNAGRCDVVMGIPSSFEMVQPTHPYYRSTYVFVTQQARHLQIHSLDDPQLRRLRIGLHVIGDDYANVPPAQALANRGIINNIVGYSIYGNYAKPNPPAALIEAVGRGQIDVAIAWGPLAGYFARRFTPPLTLAPVTPSQDSPSLRFVFAIALGVRREDTTLRVALDTILDQQQTAIHQLLTRYGVPFADDPTP